MSDPILRVAGVTRDFPLGSGNPFGKRRNVRALDGINLELMPGETLGLVGESGCGKSTLARILMALDQPTSGSVSIEGQDLASLSRAQQNELRQRVQMVFQDPAASLNPRMTVRASIAEPLGNFTALSGQEIDSRVDEIAVQVGLGQHLLDRFPHEISGGQCQRVGIARAIAIRPNVIVADEPVSALDVSIQAQILNLLMDIRAQMGLTLIFVSHDLSVVRHIADKVAVMYLGRVVEQGPIDEIFATPRHPYTRMLLRSVPHPRPQSRSQRAEVRGELPSPVNPPSGCHFRVRCPFADARCAEQAPVLESVGQGSLVACHHHNSREMGHAHD